MVRPRFTTVVFTLHFRLYLALEALGNPGWNWSSYQKYAKKVERCVGNVQGLISRVFEGVPHRFCPPVPAIMDEDFRDLYNPDSVGHDGQFRSVLETNDNSNLDRRKSHCIFRPDWIRCGCCVPEGRSSRLSLDVLNTDVYALTRVWPGMA